MTRPTWIEVDLGAVRSNVSAFLSDVAPAEVCAVVKADGYGHGDVPVAQAALDAGATVLAVALVEEGIRLREAGIEAPILLLSEPPPAGIERINRWALTPSIYSASFLRALEDSRQTPIAAHLKLDTGMHRVGTNPVEALDLARQIDRSDRLVLGGVWTHFASAESDIEFTKTQMTAFTDFVASLEAEGIHPGILHASNTAGALAYTGAHLDMVRIGIGTYGLLPDPNLDRLSLTPAMKVVSAVAKVTRLPRGERLSYGRVKPLAADAWIATVPIGYADGYRRRLGDEGVALLNGTRCELGGTVTMDQIMLVSLDEPAVGDEVVLLGVQGDEQVTADEWAAWMGSINYEVVTGMSARVPRRYLNAGARPTG